MAKRNVEKMDKSDLRAACRATGISYSKLTVAGMRDALQAKQSPAPVVNPAPAPESAPLVLATVTTAERETRNGIKRPSPGGKCAAVWEALDQMHAGGVEITAQTVGDLAVGKGWNLSNAQTESYQWKRFMGLSEPRAKAARADEHVS
jgi:hypothetical protein